MVPPGGIRSGRIRLGGRISSKPDSQAAPPGSASKTRVLFICIGNSCRSQMAEGFARAYGSDVMLARSAGLSPAMMIAPLTKQVLLEKNISVDDQFPKGLDMVSRESFDIVVNMSGTKVAMQAGRAVDWAVRDPIGAKEEVYRSVAGEIEDLVMRLILELRTAPPIRNNKKR